MKQVMCWHQLWYMNYFNVCTYTIASLLVKGRFFSGARKNPGFWSLGPAARKPAASGGGLGAAGPQNFFLL